MDLSLAVVACLVDYLVRQAWADGENRQGGKITSATTETITGVQRILGGGFMPPSELQKPGPEFACLLSNSVGTPSLSGLHTSGYAKLVSGLAWAESSAACDRDLWLCRLDCRRLSGFPLGE